MGAQEEEGARTDWAPMTWAHTEEGTHEEGTHKGGRKDMRCPYRIIVARVTFR